VLFRLSRTKTNEHAVERDRELTVIAALTARYSNRLAVKLQTIDLH